MTRTFPWELLKRCLPSCLPIGSFFEIPAVGVVLGAVPAAAAAPPTAPGRGGSTLVVISQRSQSVSQGSLPSFLQSQSVSLSGHRHESRLHDARREGEGDRKTKRRHCTGEAMRRPLCATLGCRMRRMRCAAPSLSSLSLSLSLSCVTVVPPSTPLSPSVPQSICCFFPYRSLKRRGARRRCARAVGPHSLTSLSSAAAVAASLFRAFSLSQCDQMD